MTVILGFHCCGVHRRTKARPEGFPFAVLRSLLCGQRAACVARPPGCVRRCRQFFGAAASRSCGQVRDDRHLGDDGVVNLQLLDAMTSTRLLCGDIRLDAISFDGIDELASAAGSVIHADDYMPFGSPWSRGTAEERSDRLQRWYADRLREASRDRWTMIFSVQLNGQIVGSTSLHADGFPNQRTVSTGSWLLQSVHGRGIGTLMRRMLLELAFSHLSADRATSEAWKDNWPSRRVNEKCGYLVVDRYDKARGNGIATMLRYELPRGRWSTEIRNDSFTVQFDPLLADALL